MLETVLNALGELRSPFALYESDIHAWVEARFVSAGLEFAHEARIGTGCRIDYLVGNVGVEIKKGRPDASALKRQLMRYAQCEAIHALVVLTQQGVALPESLCGKPVRSIALNRLWGVALP
ncbi:MAG: hypothetical protein MR842_04360 [Clostridiales bacterium]|nr:hypothetical protein [Clostridiales bacterium]MDO4349203.1 hypothetical protein [Eubacteriales bacterium]MDY4007728.1 hypothetical protein [Candidatus Limiplasma sp.]